MPVDLRNIEITLIDRDTVTEKKTSIDISTSEPLFSVVGNAYCEQYAYTKKVEVYMDPNRRMFYITHKKVVVGEGRLSDDILMRIIVDKVQAGRLAEWMEEIKGVVYR